MNTTSILKRTPHALVGAGVFPTIMMLKAKICNGRGSNGSKVRNGAADQGNDATASVVQLLCIVTFLLSAGDVFAVDPSTPTVDRVAVESRLEGLKDRADVESEEAVILGKLYRETIGFLDINRTHEEGIRKFTDSEKHAAAEAEKISAAVKEQPVTDPATAVAADADLDDIENLVQKAEADLAAATAQFDEFSGRLDKEDSRPNAIRQRLAEIRQSQDELAAADPVVEGESPTIVEARQWWQASRRSALRSEVKLLDIELASQPMRLELYEAQRDQAAAKAAVDRERVSVLTELLNQRRRVEADTAKSEAEAAVLEMAGKAPILQAQAEENVRLSAQLEETTEALEAAEKETNTYNEQLTRVRERFDNTRKKLAAAGVSQAVGQVLAAHRRDLKTFRGAFQEQRARARRIAAAGLQEIQHKEERRAMRDQASYIRALTSDLNDEELAEVSGGLQAIVEQRMNLMSRAVDTDGAYLRALGELDFVHQQLRQTVKEYRDFLDENLIWTRTTAPVRFADFEGLPREALRLYSPSEWAAVGRHIVAPTGRSFFILLALLAYLIVRWRSAWFDSLIKSRGTNVGRVASDKISDTIAALGLAVLVSIPLPLIMITIAWDLEFSGGGHRLSVDVASVLSRLSLWVLAIEALRRVAGADGVGEKHFHWSQNSLMVLRRELKRLLFVFVPLVGLFAVTLSFDSITAVGLLPKILLVGALLTLSYSLMRLLHSKIGVFAERLQRNDSRWFVRSAPAWGGLIAAGPVLLAVLAVAGYTNTATSLLVIYAHTMCVIGSAVIVEQLAVRWLTLTARRLARQAALDRFAAQRAAREADAAPAGDEGDLLEVTEPELDFVTLGEDSKKLVHSAVLIGAGVWVWFIWSEVFAALSVLESITLWTVRETVDGEIQQVAVSLADIGIAALVVLATIVMTRDLPALIEIILRQRLNMTQGGLYTVRTLTTYMLVLVGALVAFSVLGGRWTQFQWLIAALGVGMGFGLQEIVANFVSGLIILFERPIRVGDVVTIGDVDGVVTRIRIRATTIRQWDRTELIVPNKEFITGRVRNWSLSDTVTRIHFMVGVAYGSDQEKALELIEEAAKENENVLDDPNPFVTFEGFGDNSLDLGLRCYVNSIDIRLSTATQLRNAINRKLNDAGIVIAFPQRDVHLDTLGPLRVSIDRQPDV